MVIVMTCEICDAKVYVDNVSTTAVIPLGEAFIAYVMPRSCPQCGVVGHMRRHCEKKTNHSNDDIRVSGV